MTSDYKEIEETMDTRRVKLLTKWLSENFPDDRIGPDEWKILAMDLLVSLNVNPFDEPVR